MANPRHTRLTALFTKAIEEYTERTVKSVKFVEDPKVNDTWAIRAEMSDGQVHDYLVVFAHSKFTSDTASAGAVMNLLEDCTFTEWPPAPGPLKWF